MAAQNIPLTYKGHPLRRKDSLIYYEIGRAHV